MNGAAADTLFDVRGLTKVYRGAGGDVHALRGVDLQVRRGEVIVLLGPSGSGKSSLLNILGGLDRATAGQVVFEGQDLAKANEKALTAYRRRFVGFIFQFFNLTPSLTARENVELVTHIALDPMPADEALALVGLGARMDHFPSQLSGGEQQRVAVARALAKRPAILFCDEPTGSLDSETGTQVLDAIIHVASEVKATTMIVTHNVGIADIADRVIRFSDGRVHTLIENTTKKAPKELTW
ncbi:MAG: ABC transporter ATP-binding protein [Alphaproteobacteria bacterium]|nr:ABC transporter ATP-binding protein [Alphaproteobacteria bacterium]